MAALFCPVLYRRVKLLYTDFSGQFLFSKAVLFSICFDFRSPIVVLKGQSKFGCFFFRVNTRQPFCFPLCGGANLPLQGTKLLVRMASMRSRGESMILHPTIPAALQPKPMHMVSACLPQALQRLNGLSRL